MDGIIEQICTPHIVRTLYIAHDHISGILQKVILYFAELLIEIDNYSILHLFKMTQINLDLY